MSRLWRGLWLRAFIGAMLAIVMLRAFEYSQVYHPYADWEGQPGELHRTYEDVLIPVEGDEKISAWFFPRDAAPAAAGPVFLVCHGNGGNISHRLDLATTLLGTGASVLLFDYRGYGKSSGRPGEENTYRDAQAAYRWLRDKGFPATNIIGYGESLGGGVVAELAVREPLGALVLQSTFTSIPDIGAELFPFLPVRLISSIHYRTVAKLPRIHEPLLIMHSRTDGLIPYHHAELNFAAANQPKFFLEIQGHHNDGLGPSRAEAVAALQRLLDLAAGRASPRLD